MSNESVPWRIPLTLCAMLGLAGCAADPADPAQAFRMGESSESLPLASSSTGDTGTSGSGASGWGTSGSGTSGSGASSWGTSSSGTSAQESTSGSDTDESDDEFVDPWEPGELWLDDFVWLSDEEGSSESDGTTSGTTTSGTSGDTGDTETGEDPPKQCKDGEFTIFILVKLKHGVDGNMTIAAGTLTKIGEETEGGVVNREYLACIPGDKIVGPMAPGVRITATVAGMNPADRVVGMRRGIDRNWIGKCNGDPATSCHIDAKFNANGTNTLPIAVAIVLVEFARIETAPPPHEVPPE